MSNDKAIDFSEFLEKREEVVADYEASPEEEENAEPEDIDVQKAVVEELASEKAKLEEDVASLNKEIEDLKAKNAELESCVESLKSVIAQKEAEQKELETEVLKTRKEKNEIEEVLQKSKELIAAAEEKEFQMQERNPNSLALLDRDVDVPDRFPGETRDHVIEVIREARDKAEEEGRVRKAQLLESVLVANESSGNLAKKRANLEKFFAMNGNIVNGTVMEELSRCGIQFKNGEDYLLPKEILQRTY